MPTLRLTVQHDYAPAGGPGINVWHYRTATATTSQDDVDLAATRLQTFYSAIADRFSGDSVLTLQEQVVDVDTSEVVGATPWAINGASPADAYLPTAVQVVLNWRTSNVSRSGRGRSFFGPLANSSALDTNGTPSLALLTDITTAGAALIDSQAGVGDGAFGVYSPTQGVIRDFTSCYTRDSFAVLTSRRD